MLRMEPLLSARLVASAAKELVPAQSSATLAVELLTRMVEAAVVDLVPAAKITTVMAAVDAVVTVICPAGR